MWTWQTTRAERRLKILIAINLAMKILILVNPEINRIKTYNEYQLPKIAHVISLKRKTIISQTVCAVTL